MPPVLQPVIRTVFFSAVAMVSLPVEDGDVRPDSYGFENDFKWKLRLYLVLYISCGHMFAA